MFLKKIRSFFSDFSKREKTHKNTGRITYVNRKKGYGFIKSKDHERLFVHFSDAAAPLKKGMPVTFHIKETDKGLKATAVAPIPQLSRNEAAQ